MSKTKSATTFNNLGQLIRHLGGIDPERIRLSPTPGTATEADLLRVLAREDVLCELIDGILVEKVMGAKESGLGLFIGQQLQNYLDAADLGLAFAAGSTLRFMPGLVRLPDVSVVFWDKLPDRCYPDEPIPDLVPDLAVEILSESNTPAEMSQKRRDYFFCGVSLVWIIDPKKRTVTVYTSPEDMITLGETDTLTGGEILPGFCIPVARIFQHVRRQPPTPQRTSRRKKKPD